MPTHTTQHLIILNNEQPIKGCKTCEILWYQILDYMKKWKARPSELEAQDLYIKSFLSFVEHRQTHQPQEVQVNG